MALKIVNAEDKARENNKPVTVVTGGHWGDESKGSTIASIINIYDVIARFNGGHNAGHTVPVNGDLKQSHLLPSGYLMGKPGYLGRTMVIDPFRLCYYELPVAERCGAKIQNLHIDHKIPVVLPHYVLMELIEEELRRSKGCSIGTTLSGMGPTSSHKISRDAVLIGQLGSRDLLKEGLLSAEGELEAMIKGYDLDRSKLKEVVSQNSRFSGEEKKLLLRILGSESIIVELEEAAEQIIPCVTDVPTALRLVLDRGEKILVEGAQGAMLDPDYGAYPMVTTTPTTVLGVPQSLGISTDHMNNWLVIRFLMSKVGGGAFPTAIIPNDLLKDLGYRKESKLKGDDLLSAINSARDLRGEDRKIILDRVLRDFSNNYGTTTGRPRMNGYFDAVITTYAARVNDLGRTELMLTLLDLAETISACGQNPLIATSYTYKGPYKVIAGKRFSSGDKITADNLIATDEFLDWCEPNYQELPKVTSRDLEMVRRGVLTESLKQLISTIEDETGFPIGGFRIGPKGGDVYFLAKHEPGS